MRKFLLLILLIIMPIVSFADSETTIGGKTAQAIIIQNNGVSLRPRPYLNFTTGLTCSDVNGKTECAGLPGYSDADAQNATGWTKSGSNVYLTATSDSVGIGKSNPSFKLDVNGIINGTALYVNGTPYIGSQWTNNGTDIYYNAGNVGIGTSTPSEKLEVVGDVLVNAVDTGEITSKGGVITTHTSGLYEYVVHTFSVPGTATFVAPTVGRYAQIMVVGGGGGGGYRGGGGGGAGGLLYHSNYELVGGQTYYVNVGVGGKRANPSVQSGSSYFGTSADSPEFIAYGGGEGNGESGTYSDDGGSGGGGAWSEVAPGDATQISMNGAIGYGNAGGRGIQNYPTLRAAGGGGGAGGVGAGNGVTPNGGIGFLHPILGSYYAGGGGGGSQDPTECPGPGAGSGGLGGGGNGGTTGVGSNGENGTGGGGGGGSKKNNSDGGYGGSGVVIITYKKAINSSKITLADEGTPVWDIISDGSDEHTLKIKDGDGTTQVAIKQPSGNVGIGTTTPSSMLDIGGSFGSKVTIVSGNTSLNETHHKVIVTNTATITLPSAVGIEGREYNIIASSGIGTVTIIGTGGQTIRGEASVEMYDAGSIVVISNGTNWERGS